MFGGSWFNFLKVIWIVKWNIFRLNLQLYRIPARFSLLWITRDCHFQNILKVLLRSKFNVKFVTKTLSFQLIRSGCTCFGHWSELWRPLSENIELENVGFSRPPLQIYVPVTKLLFSDCDVIFWTRQENKPEPWENSEQFSKLRDSAECFVDKQQSQAISYIRDTGQLCNCVERKVNVRLVWGRWRIDLG